MSTHTASVETVSPNETGGIVGGRDFAEPVDISCAIMPGRAGAIYQQFNIEINAPFELYTSVDNASLLTNGSRVFWDSKNFFVKASEVYKGFAGSANHMRVILERERTT